MPNGGLLSYIEFLREKALPTCAKCLGTGTYYNEKQIDDPVGCRCKQDIKELPYESYQDYLAAKEKEFRHNLIACKVEAKKKAKQLGHL